MKIIKYWLMIILLGAFTVACSDDDDFSETIFDFTEEELTPLDQWLKDNFGDKHNIEIIYKWDDFESNQELQLVPPEESKVQPFLELIQKIWMNPYLTLGGLKFFNETSPKQIMLIGSAGYMDDGMYLLGEAEQGNRITVYAINTLDATKDTDVLLRHAHTFHHEYIHILHQTIKYPPAFEELTAAYYTTNWSSVADPYELGFVSQYAMENANEDFCETITAFIMMTEEEWIGLLNYPQSKEGKEALKQKETIVLQYMKNNWGIDLYQLRRLVQTEINKLIVEINESTN